MISKSKILNPDVILIRDCNSGSFQELLLIQIKYGKIYFYNKLNQLATLLIPTVVKQNFVSGLLLTANQGIIVKEK